MADNTNWGEWLKNSAIGGAILFVVTSIFRRKRDKADTKLVEIQADEKVSNLYKQYAEDVKADLEKTKQEFHFEVDSLKALVEKLKDENKKLSAYVSTLEKENERLSKELEKVHKINTELLKRINGAA